MRFATSFAAVMAFAASALAQTANFDPVTKPTKNEKVPAGSNYEITWEPSSKYPGPVTISLIGGKTQDTQTPMGDIATGVTGNSYSWAVKSSLGAEKVYGLVIKLESNPKIFQYSFPFQITGSAGGDSSADDSTQTTVTTSHGIKTVTLSSSTATSASTSSTSSTSSTPKTTSSTTAITSTSATPSLTKVTSTLVVNPSTDAPATTAAATTGPSASPTNAAAAIGAPMALIGGLAVAIFAL